ncbi:MAG: hypothetical protein WC793_03015 [Candidatus Paceibacterota bacterium]|jgi:uncharacterized membrane protein
MNADKKNYFKLTPKFFLKFFVGLFLCLFVRLIPVRAPNIEPILATMMPFSRIYGALVGFSFAVLSILLYDVVTHTLGVQTFFTVFAYGVLGLWSANYFKKQKSNSWSFVRFAIIGTLFFDAITGLTVGPIFFHQSFMQSLVGQIPFTALHLLGNITFALILSPAIYHSLIRKKKKEGPSFINTFNPKTI